METIPWRGCLELFAAEDFVRDVQWQGLKPIFFCSVLARLKSCPDTTSAVLEVTKSAQVDAASSGVALQGYSNAVEKGEGGFKLAWLAGWGESDTLRTFLLRF